MGGAVVSEPSAADGGRGRVHATSWRAKGYGCPRRSGLLHGLLLVVEEA